MTKVAAKESDVWTIEGLFEKNLALGFGEQCGQSLTKTEVSCRQLITEQYWFPRLNSMLIIQALGRVEYGIIQSQWLWD